MLHYLPGGDDKGDTYVPAGTPKALTRAFFPAFATDNPDLMVNDPGYVDRLDALDRVAREQMKHGDWAVKPGKGEYFQRGWWKYLDSAPPRSARRRAVRSWDLAATVDGDWTVGALQLDTPTLETPFVIEDVVRFRGTPHTVHAKLLATAESDGHEVEIILPIDPGQAGLDQAESFKRLLRGYILKFVRPTGDKTLRARPHSSAVENGLVALVRGPWNGVWVEEHQDFPTKGVPDDCIDSGSQGFNELAGVVPADVAGWSAALAGIRVGRPEAIAKHRGDVWLPDEDDEDTLFSRRD